jgi:hypothetical protein
VALARLLMLLVRARGALAGERLLALRLGGLRLGLRARPVGLRASDLCLAADLTCLGAARLELALAARAA